MASTLGWLANLDGFGAHFRARLQPGDLLTVHRAQACFLASQYTAVLLYYAGSAERPTKFPASISYCASKGPPKYANISLWLIGWSMLLEMFRNLGDDFIFPFLLQMVATGLVNFWTNSPGQSHRANLVHMVTALFYILDHVVLLAYMGTPQWYRATFMASFFGTVAALQSTSYIKRRVGLPPKYASDPREWEAMLKVAGPAWRGPLWWSEVAFMFCENMIFTVFLLGMAAGLPESR